MATAIQLKRRIMRRIYMLYLVRLAYSAPALKLYALLAGVALAAAFVSLGNIIANMPPLFDADKALKFWANALLNTELLVQFFVAVAAVSFILLCGDVFAKLTGRNYSPAAG